MNNARLDEYQEDYDLLSQLALDIRMVWNQDNDMLWRRINPDLWEATQNPWAVLQTASRSRLHSLLTEPGFRQSLEERWQARARDEDAPTWFAQAHPESGLTQAAYFSMEFMLSEALPIYSGGLGNVAGDQLKAASDLGVPVIGVGLLYQQGYFRQVIDRDGAQHALYPYNSPEQLPISPLRTAEGEWLRLPLVFPGGPVWLRAWQVQVGRVRLYLLDANDPANSPAHRAITSELYGGGPELRLQQEIVLGIGGWQLLEALGHSPEVCHLNEGHAAFAILERARAVMQRTGLPFAVALTATRAGNLFTTHTAVAAGFDTFPPALIERYLGSYASELGLSLRDLLALGRQHPDNSSEEFHMAYLALQGSGAMNGVSRLHGEVSRLLFVPLYPRWPLAEVPVGHITNGIHVPTWCSASADTLSEDSLRGVSDARLWELRAANRKSFVDAVRQRFSRQQAISGASPEAIESAKSVLNPDVLTLGFARRFAPYKRPNLLLRDPERLIRLLNNPDHPLQIVLAGKAHPADRNGQALLQQWVRFLQRPEVRDRAIFLADYDMRLTAQMVAGVDVWLNTPRRPWEACGTSGMKILANGGLNFSERDGWWAEAYTPEVGWALGDNQDWGDDSAQDAADAEALYAQLEQEIIPEFYRRDDAGIATTWTARMRESMARLTPQFSATRTVTEYVERYYLPAASAYRRRADQGAAESRQIAEWQQEIERLWPTLRFGAVTVAENGAEREVTVEVFLNGLAADAIRVELYAEGREEFKRGEAERIEMTRGKPLSQGFLYQASLSKSRPTIDYTARILPHNSAACIPLEATQILWQH